MDQVSGILKMNESIAQLDPDDSSHDESEFIVLLINVPPKDIIGDKQDEEAGVAALTKKSFEDGDHVTVTGEPELINGTKALIMTEVTRL